MKRITILAVLSGCLCFDIGPAAAYDLATHGKMINFAYDKSLLAAPDSALLKRLGIDVWVLDKGSRDAPFRADGVDLYYDIAQSQVAVREAKYYENKIITKDLNLKDELLTVRGWLMRGVIREDDGGLIAGTKAREPLDDPRGNINRFCNHFLDPILTHGSSGRGFSGFCFFDTDAPLDAAQWALGSMSPFDSQPYENTARRNHFSVLDARDMMWRALTLKDKTGNNVPTNGFTPEKIRKVYWASTFRALGDVVHLLQDQAQPQHTRDEGHGLTHTGYEEYINERALNVLETKINDQNATPQAGATRNLIYDGYDIPRFNRYSDFWSTRLRGGGALGLSDYSNRGFFTVAKNFGNTEYAEPSNSLGDYTLSGGGTDQLTYLVGNMGVRDDVTGIISNPITMSTASIFSGMGIPNMPSDRQYTLSKKNFDDRADLLIPRAVAYSAGLINYFFRGSLEINRPSDGVFAAIDHGKSDNQCTYNPQSMRDCGFKKFKMKLKNTTPDIFTNAGGGIFKQDMSGGKLYAVAKFHNNTCFDPSFQRPIYGPGFSLGCRTTEEFTALSDVYSTAPFTLSAGEEKELEFTFNNDAIPFSATDLFIQVVYRGKLGAEDDAVVVTTHDISEPTFITLANYTDVRIKADDKTCTLPLPTSPKKPFYFDAKLYVLVGKLFDPGPPEYRELIVTHLEPAQYVRMAFLGDALEANMFARAYLPPNFGGPWTLMDNAVRNIVNQIVTPTLFQKKADGLIYYPNEEYKVREGYGNLWGIYNSRFLDLLDGNVPPGVPFGYDDVVKIIKDCPGSMALVPIDTLSF